MNNELIKEDEAIAETIQQEEDKWNYWVWQCQCSDDRMRPNGNKITEGCGHVNVRKSQRDMTGHKPKGGFQDKCRGILENGKKCGRGRRLNGGNTSIFRSKIEADRHVRRLLQ